MGRGAGRKFRDEATDVGEITPEYAEFCAAGAALDEGDGPPEAEDIQEWAELAPEEISEDAQLVADEFFGAVEDELGTSSTADPGEEAVLNADLEPGVYGIACFIESEEDGVPHFFKGMAEAFSVE
jgi:hypothetical protein